MNRGFTLAPPPGFSKGPTSLISSPTLPQPVSYQDKPTLFPTQTTQANSSLDLFEVFGSENTKITSSKVNKNDNFGFSSQPEKSNNSQNKGFVASQPYNNNIGFGTQQSSNNNSGFGFPQQQSGNSFGYVSQPTNNSGFGFPQQPGNAFGYAGQPANNSGFGGSNQSTNDNFGGFGGFGNTSQQQPQQQQNQSKPSNKVPTNINLLDF